MTERKVLAHRFRNQGLSGSVDHDPGSAVRRLGALQAQDYAACLWAIGVRSSVQHREEVEKAFALRHIVRSWVLRGTLHVTAAEDLRWMLALIGPRVIRQNAGRNRQLELDEVTFRQSETVIRGALEGGRTCTRAEIKALLAEAGISPAGQRTYHILNRLGLGAVLCFGVPRGKEPTFALVEEWLPPSDEKEREEAVVELARRYFTSRGPASVEDFVWWSGLTLTDARLALDALRGEIERVRVGERDAYWSGTVGDQPPTLALPSHLLPAFDEYVLAYRDRSLILDDARHRDVVSRNGIFWPVMVQDGRVVGTWKGTQRSDTLHAILQPFAALSKRAVTAFTHSAKTYAHFFGARQVEMGMP